MNKEIEPVPILDGGKTSKKAFCKRGGMKTEIYLNQFWIGPNELKSRVECNGWDKCIHYQSSCPYYHKPPPTAFDSFGGWV